MLPSSLTSVITPSSEVCINFKLARFLPSISTATLFTSSNSLLATTISWFDALDVLLDQYKKEPTPIKTIDSAIASIGTPYCLK